MIHFLTAQPRAEGDVLPNAQPGVKQIFLPHPRQAAGYRLAVAGDHFPAGGGGQAGHDPQQAGFSGPAGAEQRHPLAAGDRQRQIVEQAAVAEMEAQIADLDTWRRHAWDSAAALSPICQNCASRRVAVVKMSLSSVIRDSLPRCCHTVSSSASAALTPCR